MLSVMPKNGLNMESNVVHSGEYFLKHLNKRFYVPLPESIDVAIEDTSGHQRPGYCRFVGILQAYFD